MDSAQVVANLSSWFADMVRAALKEPAKSAAKTRETVYFRASQWKDGKPATNGEHHCASIC